MRTYGIRDLAVPGVLAAVAAALTLVYVGHGGTKPAAAAGTNGVYVATRDIAAGASGGDVVHALRLVHVTSDSVVPDAVTSTTELTGRVVLTPIYQGQQLTLRAFGAVRQQGLAGQLSGRLRAIQVAGDQDQVLAGTLRDGDHVDVVASLKVGSAQSPRGRTVLRNVLVLHAPSGPSSGGPVSASQTYSTTLQLTDAQAQTLFFVTQNGDWSFVLRPVVHAGDSGDFVDSVDSVLKEGR